MTVVRDIWMNTNCKNSVNSTEKITTLLDHTTPVRASAVRCALLEESKSVQEPMAVCVWRAMVILY